MFKYNFIMGMKPRRWRSRTNLTFVATNLHHPLDFINKTFKNKQSSFHEKTRYFTQLTEFIHFLGHLKSWLSLSLGDQLPDHVHHAIVRYGLATPPPAHLTLLGAIPLSAELAHRVATRHVAARLTTNEVVATLALGTEHWFADATQCDRHLLVGCAPRCFVAVTVLVFEAKKKSAVICICRILKFIMMITVINKE